jgi:hypothetical protein
MPIKGCRPSTPKLPAVMLIIQVRVYFRRRRPSVDKDVIRPAIRRVINPTVCDSVTGKAVTMKVIHSAPMAIHYALLVLCRLPGRHKRRSHSISPMKPPNLSSAKSIPMIYRCCCHRNHQDIAGRESVRRYLHFMLRVFCHGTGLRVDKGIG